MHRTLPASVLILLLVVQLAGGLLMFPQRAEAAMSITGLGRWGGENGGTAWAGTTSTTRTSTSFSSSNNTLLVAVFAGWNECAGGAVDTNDVSIAGGGLTWTAVDAVASDPESNCASYLKVWTAPVTTGASMSVVVTIPDSHPDPNVAELLNVFSVTGYNTADPIGAQINGKNVGADSVTLTLPQAPASDSIVLAYAGAIIASSGEIVSTPGAGWSEQYDIAWETNTHLQTQTRTGSVSTSVSWNDIGTGAGADPLGVTSIAGAIEIKAMPDSSALTKPPNNLGLIGFWNFNEATSTAAADYSGSGLHMTMEGNATWGVGRYGGGLLLDGTGDRTSRADPNTLDVANITVCAWARRTGGGDGDTFQNIVSKAEEPNAGFGMNLDPEGTGATWTVFEGGSTYTVSGSVTTTSWHHYCGVLDDTGGTQYLYIDGVEVDNGVAGISTTNTADLYFGTDDGGFGDFQGNIDEVRIYNRALTAPQIAALYGNGTAGAVRANASSKTLTNGTTLGPGSGLMGHWSFDGGDVRWSSESAGTAYDRSGNNYHGTLTDMTRTISTAIGKLGQGMFFDSSDDDIVVAGNNSLNITGALTIATWVKVNTVSGLHNLVGKGDEPSDATQYGLSYTGDELTLYICYGTDAACNADTTGASVTSTNANLTTNTWYHVAVTYSDSGNAVIFYKDGQPLTDDAGSAETQSLQSSTYSVIIGELGDGQATNGTLDDVRIYNRVLSPAEILQLSRLGAVKVVQ